ncbi:S-layer homology domain-containing protein [bacterium]|nr:S-layer homology domain-containing protein [bacterium]MBT6293654.1 S-layer homology domain-containing protein [bacterium]
MNQKDWYYKYVKKAYELEIVKGYKDGIFKPGQTINLAEMSKILDTTGKNLNNKNALTRGLFLYTKMNICYKNRI